jgi:hypothetical protein
MKKQAVKKSKTNRKTTSFRPFRVNSNGQPQCENSAEYRQEDGFHVVTLKLRDGVYTVLRVVAQALMPNKPTEQYVLRSVCDSTAELLPQITEDEAKKIVEQWPGGTQQAKNRARQIVLNLPEKAYTILAGRAAAGGFDGPEHWILFQTSSLCAQSTARDYDEKEYARLFGLKVEANGDTRL